MAGVVAGRECRSYRVGVTPSRVWLGGPANAFEGIMGGRAVTDRTVGRRTHKDIIPELAVRCNPLFEVILFGFELARSH